MFINNLLTLLVVGFAVFLLVRSVNRMKEKEEATPTEPPKPSQDIVLLSEIRDLLKNR